MRQDNFLNNPDYIIEATYYIGINAPQHVVSFKYNEAREVCSKLEEKGLHPEMDSDEDTYGDTTLYVYYRKQDENTEPS